MPPVIIGTNFGSASTAALRGFIPGMYAAYFEAPTDTNFASPLTVTLSAPGSSFTVPGSVSQGLMVYVK